MVHLTYGEFDPRTISQNITFEQLHDLLNRLLLHVDGDVQEAIALLRRLQARGVLPANLDLEAISGKMTELDLVGMPLDRENLDPIRPIRQRGVFIRILAIRGR